MRNRMFGAALVAGALLVAPATAGAHVTVHPNALPAEGYTIVNVNVPNEEASADTTKVEVQMPPGFASASTVPLPGWTAKTSTSKLATPIQTDDGPIDTQVDTITWTADKGAGLPPGTLGQFPISVKIPGKAGDILTFKALQTYSDGEVVRWIGAPGSDKPAPTVAVTESDEAVEDFPAGAPGVAQHSHGGDDADDAAEDAADHASASAATDGDHAGEEDHDDDGLAIAALIVGGLGLIAGVGAFVVARRKA